MANKISGRVLMLTPIQEIPTRSGKTFQKREIVIERTVFDRDTGQPTTDSEDTPIFRLTGSVAQQAESIQQGDNVTIHYDLEGRSYLKEGIKTYFTDIRVFRVESASSPSQTPTAPISESVSEPMSEPFATPARAETGAELKDDLPF